MIRVVGPKEPKEPGLSRELTFVNTTSRATGWQRGLSPFFLGPVPLYEGAGVAEARNVENAWQFSKVYEEHVGPEGTPTPAYFTWAREGWLHRRAIRYPRGKGAVPSFSWWDGVRLDYVAARKRIYVPCYTRAVLASPSFHQLLALYREQGEVTLWDFDGYDHHKLGMSLKDVLNDPDRKMGHAFVLAMLLERMA